MHLSSNTAFSSERCRLNGMSHALNRNTKLHVSAIASLPRHITQKFTKAFFKPNAPDLGTSNPRTSWKQNFNAAFTKTKLIGSGSSAQVHIAINKATRQEVAVKTLCKIRGKSTEEKTMEKICHETDMLDMLRDAQGIVSLEACFEDATSVHLVTELCAKGDLQNHVDAYGPLEEKALAMVAFEILKAVKDCHDLGIFHGDIKPANFCFTDTRILMRNPYYNGAMVYLKAVDMGSSQVVGEQRLTKRSGTPLFMSPEVFAGDYSVKADVWSFGVTLYWLFSKRFPFFGSGEMTDVSCLEDVAGVVHTTELDFDYVPWTNMSREGIDLIRRCLTKNERSRVSVEEAIKHPWFTKWVDAENQALVLSGRFSQDAKNSLSETATLEFMQPWI